MRPYALSLALVAATLAGPAAPAAAQAPGPADQIRVWFEGTSNIHPFTCQATGVDGGENVPVPAVEQTPNDPAGEHVSLRIPVAGLDCGIALMNQHLRHALHGKRHPAIHFTLAEYELVPADSGWSVRMNGRLAIAGVEREVTVHAQVEQDGAGVAHLRGAHALDVTDYGIQPPRRFLGLVRVRERVTVHFDVPLPGRVGLRTRATRPAP